MGGDRSVPSASLVRNGEQRNSGVEASRRRRSGWQVPAGGAADGEAALFESLKGEPEAGVVDAQALPEHGPGEGLAGAGQSGAHRLGERGRRGGGTVDEQREGLVGAASEAQQERVRSGSGAVLDGELQPVVGAPQQIAGGVGPGMQIGGAAQGLAEIAAGALGQVVDEDQGELIAAVESAQKAEQGSDVRGAVLILCDHHGYVTRDPLLPDKCSIATELRV